MAKRIAASKPTGSVRDVEKTRSANGSSQRDIVRRFLWDIASINVHLDEIRHFWAQTLGISGPQWMILMAVADLDRGQGVPVKDVSTMLHVDPSFVTTQSKVLEKYGFVRRITSSHDARVVLMSLSDKACKQVANLSSRQEQLDKFIFADFNDRTLKDIADQLAALKDRLEKAALKLAADI
ncbi:MAG: winged helix-turn-helix transcriptional regulator [Rhizobiales bacterium]|nr:winged helix-turn-helix transcriptional regulator [Hyphomicrobiales bacterium]